MFKASKISKACLRLTLAHSHLQPKVNSAPPATRAHSTQSTRPLTRASAAAMERLQALQNVKNARDLADATSKIAPGRILRSANPANGTADDVRILRNDLGIAALFDFRSTEEHKEDKGWSLMLSNGVIKNYDLSGNLTEVTVDHNEELKGLDLPRCELHRLSLLERERFIRALIWRLPAFKVAQALACKAFGYKDKMKDILVPEINRAGLPLVYQIVLDTASADILRTLELMTLAATSRTPQLIFCKLGKDRTGLMAALVLSCCGATEDEIVADYAKSDGVDDVALGGIEKMKDVEGMDRALFASAPPEVMRSTLRYVEEKYGSMKGYMESIGFVEEDQKKLAAALSPDVNWG